MIMRTEPSASSLDVVIQITISDASVISAVNAINPLLITLFLYHAVQLNVRAHAVYKPASKPGRTRHPGTYIVHPYV
jgi:hypothetical protein